MNISRGYNRFDDAGGYQAGDIEYDVFPVTENGT